MLFATAMSMLKVLSILISLAAGLSAFAQSAELSLTRADYHKILGSNLPLLDAAWDLTHNYGKQRTGIEQGSDLTTITMPMIREAFAKHAPNRRIFSIRRHRLSAEFRYDGWIITTDEARPVKIGLRNAVRDDGSTCNTYITIGYSPESDDNLWFARNWFSPSNLEPFKAMIVLPGDAGSLETLLVEGRRFDLQGRVVEEIEKQFATRPLEVIQRNPAPKSLEEIYSSRLPPGKTLNEVLNLAWDARRVPVAIFDSGVDYNHPSIAYKLCRKLAPEVREKAERDLRTVEEQLKYNESFYFAETRRASALGPLREQKAALQRVLSTDGRGWDFVENESLPYDYGRDPQFGMSLSHGTAVADVAAGRGESTCVVPVRLIDFHDEQDFSKSFERALDYAKLAGVRIINMSYTQYDISDADALRLLRAQQTPEDVIARSIEEGRRNRASHERIKLLIKNNPNILFVVSSGNETESQIKKLNADLPAVANHQQKNMKYPNVIFVASIKQDKSLSSFSVYGKQSVHLAAYGDSQLLPIKEGKERETMGTSFSAPLVANRLGQLLYSDRNSTTAALVLGLRQQIIRTPELNKQLIWGGYIQ